MVSQTLLDAHTMDFNSIDQDVLLKDLLTNSEIATNKEYNSRNRPNDSLLSDQTYMFLREKLSDANSTIESFSQHELNLKNEIDRLKKDNDEKAKHISSLKSELQVFRNTQLNVEQKLDQETKKRFSLQDQVSDLEKEVNEKVSRNNHLEEKLKHANEALQGNENYNQQVYKIASEACDQSSSLSEQVQILEEMLDICKSKLHETFDENKVLKSNFALIESKYSELENDFQDKLNEIEQMREDATKQEEYINETLNRFREIGIHFANMKNHFLQQHETLKSYHGEILKRSTNDDEKFEQLSKKIIELNSTLQEMRLRFVF